MDRGRREFVAKAIAGGAVVAGLGARHTHAQGAQRDMPASAGTKALISNLDLKYPIFQAPTSTVAGPDVTIAVSNAGGLGAIGLTWTPPDQTRDMITRIRSATNRDFAVNYVLTFEPASLPAALEAGAPVIQFSWGMPDNQLVSAVRRSGAKLGIQVTSAGGARQALDLGADYLVCQGIEAGGHVQAHRPLLETLRDVLAEAGETPVVASGGIGNGADIRKVLLAGASGAMLGTRFVATTESRAHPTYKEALSRADAADTVLTVCFDGGWPNGPHRVLRNATFTNWEAAGCPPAGRRPGEGDAVAVRLPDRRIPRYAISSALSDLEGDVTDLALYAGLSVEKVRDISPAGELVNRLWEEYLAA